MARSVEDNVEVIGGSNGSLYGKGLAQGLSRLRSVSAYLDGALEEGAISDALAQR